MIRLCGKTEEQREIQVNRTVKLLITNRQAMSTPVFAKSLLKESRVSVKTAC